MPVTRPLPLTSKISSVSDRPSASVSQLVGFVPYLSFSSTLGMPSPSESVIPSGGDELLEGLVRSFVTVGHSVEHS